MSWLFSSLSELCVCVKGAMRRSLLLGARVLVDVNLSGKQMAEADHILADAQLRARMGVAVMTLARQRATTRVKEQFRAQGLKVAHMSHREIVVAAEEYLFDHPELIAEAKPTVHTRGGSRIRLLMIVHHRLRLLPDTDQCSTHAGAGRP